jgi:hypothetical protein
MASTYDDLALIAPHLSEADVARLRETTASKCAAHGGGVALDEGTGEPLNSTSCAFTFLRWFFRRTLVLSLNFAKASRSQPIFNCSFFVQNQNTRSSTIIVCCLIV